MERIINIPLKIDEQFIEDVLTTAFEGGISYWCSHITRVTDEPTFPYHAEFIAYGGTALLHLDEPIDEDGPDAYEMDADIFCKGLEKFLASQGAGNDMIDVDAGNFDADMADCVVQYAIFGELVFS